MRRFVFTLESVYGYKQTVEKKQKAELAAINARLQALYDEDRRLTEAFERCAASLEELFARRKNIIEELADHAVYFKHLQETRAELAVRIEKAEEEKRQLQAQLILTMREIKTLENLKAEQYLAYLEEVRKEEEQAIGDLVSYQVTVESSEPEY